MGRRLAEWLVGGRVTACAVNDARLVRPAAPAAVVEALLGRTIEGVDRRGKWLRISLDDQSRLFVHLAMTGWFERAEDAAPLRFERARLTVLRGGKRGRATHVVYVDPRRWGRWVSSREDLATWTLLGPDPLRDAIDPRALHARIARRKTSSIKEAVMDQSILAGVGNIQAIEALWRAKLDPRSPAAALSLSDVRALLRGVDWTIARTLANLATDGPHQEKNPFVVYGRKGEPCPRCKTLFARILLGGRTTTYCPGCQRRLARSPEAPKERVTPGAAASKRAASARRRREE